ncbi:MAG: discoidin domain-containing protein [Saprospiraceae bacterium]|nr:discoidin domain-containing protein [Saprospiraceae bacterium]
MKKLNVYWQIIGQILFILVLTTPAYPQINVALNKNYVASAALDINTTPDKAFDHNIETIWNAAGFAPQWIEVDLGVSHIVDSIRLITSQAPDGVTTTKVYQDYGNWVVLEDTTLYTTDYDTITFYYPNAITTDGIKVEITSSPSWIAWREIEVFGSVVCPGGSILYVDDDVVGGNNDGSNWANAFTSLQDALSSACSNISEIRVAEGTYKPSETGVRLNAFNMKNNLILKGGYPNGGGTRDWNTYQSILDGNIGTPDASDNSYQVIDNYGLNATAQLDGFHVVNGNANYEIDQNSIGGGMLNVNSSPTITNCFFYNNTAFYGGGIYNYDFSSPHISNCIISNNSSTFWGGGMYNYQYSSPEIINCLFYENATGASGGAIVNAIVSSPIITNSTLTDNTAVIDGGGISNFDISYPMLTNCILWNNGTEISGSMANVDYSDVQGGYSGTSNVDLDPLFIDVANDDYHILPCSPIKNIGTTSGAPISDWDGDVRPIGAGIDLGYDEEVFLLPEIAVDTLAVGTDFGDVIIQSSSTFTYTIENLGIGDLNIDTITSSDGYFQLSVSGPLVIMQGENLTFDVTFTPPNFGSYSSSIEIISNDCGESLVGFDLLGSGVCAGDTLYVDQSATGNGAGNNWENAFTSLMDALTISCPNVTEIRVAEGIYTPTSGADRSISFNMKDNVKILGGFPTGGGVRNYELYETILSGDIGVVGDSLDNSYHVMYNSGLNPTAEIDGFTITEGHADDGTLGPNSYGGGMYNTNASPTITNCKFQNNSSVRGGGMVNIFNSTPMVNNCIISGNRSSEYGAGILHETSSGFFNDCIIEGNMAATSGGGISNNKSSPTYINCLFRGNTASTSGGCLFTSGTGNPILTNCTIVENTAAQGGAIYIDGTSSIPQVTNCILWSNDDEIVGTSTVTYSIVEGGYSGVGNIDKHPNFVDAENGDFHIEACSWARDAGTNVNAPTIDIDGDVRPFGGGFDLGYDENTTEISSIIYVDSSAAGDNSGFDWANAFTDLQEALNCNLATQIRVAKGTYTPTNGSDRSISFSMRNNLTLLGGYPSGGGDRDWDANPTILSGDIGTQGDSLDNSFHVIANYFLNGSAILDGFTITEAYGVDGTTSINTFGGGIFNDNSSPKILNCKMIKNTGRIGVGMINLNNSSGIIENCTFSNNYALFGGAGMSNYNFSYPTISKCTISQNTSAYRGAGMLNFNHGSPALTNCLIANNNADTDAGGIFNNSTSSPSFTHCTIAKNSAPLAGGIYSLEASSVPIFKNCIIWNNGTEISGTANVTYSLIDGGYTGTGNLSCNPQFLDEPNNDFRLSNSSSAINNGTSIGASAQDFEYDVRPIGLGYDMGFDEFAGEFIDTMYVDQNATGDNTGLDWANAFTDLKDALKCIPAKQIYVAEGTYKPTSDTDRFASFVMRNNLTILGGFPTGGGVRDWENNVTILSGDIGVQDDITDNSYHVISNEDLDSTFVMDGFTIAFGNANGSGFYQYGGGIFNNFSSPIIRNCIFDQNQAVIGGAVYSKNSYSTFDNCIFSLNVASYRGAGFYNLSSSLNLNRCVFKFNNITTIFDANSSVKLTNSLFYKNEGSFSCYLGVGNSNVEIINCTLTENIGNRAIQRGASATITNSILRNPGTEIVGSSNVSYSNIEGGYPGTGNLDVEPNFVDASNDDYHILGCSLMKDAGTAVGAPAQDYDLDPRPLGNGIDIGYDETTLIPGPTLVYVDSLATGDNDGRDWQNAFTNLTDALFCQNITEIHVAEGTYYPTSGTDRTVAFPVRNNLSIFGGYPSGGGQRDWENNTTILSGDIGVQGDMADNSHHIFYNINLDSTFVIDGFTITGGNANAGFPYDRGGAIYNSASSIVVKNCTFDNNQGTYGGAVFNGEISSCSFNDCIFSNNLAILEAGALYNSFSSQNINRCVFKFNKALSIAGGILENSTSISKFTNCLFYGNDSPNISCYYSINGSFPEIMNCTFTGNTAGVNGVLFSIDPPIITNSIFRNPGVELGYTIGAVTYSNVEGGIAGVGNVDVDPMFMDTLNHNYHIEDCSPMRNIGAMDGAPSVDFEGDSRPSFGGVDIGYDEATEPIPPSIVYVDEQATGDNDGRDWANAYTHLVDALYCTNVTEVHVAEGTYVPTSSGDRSLSFSLRNNLSLYGGYPTGGGVRDWNLHPAILSGDIGIIGDNSDNSYNVIKNEGIDSTAVLDGFVIKLGNANQADAPGKEGGGIRNFESHPKILNCTFEDNVSEAGGTIFNFDSDPLIQDCVFTNNTGGFGGAIHNYLSDPQILDCDFNSNTSTQYGGAVYNNISSPLIQKCNFIANHSLIAVGAINNFDNSNPVITQCVFKVNSGTNDTGAMVNHTHSNAIISNCLFDGNTAPFYAAMINYLSAPTLINCTFVNHVNNEVLGIVHNSDENVDSTIITNCIFWNTGVEISGSAVVDHSNVKGGYAGVGNLDLDPLFVDAINGDYHLQPCSPMKEAGTSVGAPTIDFEGDIRPAFDFHDIGFDEDDTYVNNVAYVDSSIVGGNSTGVDWSNAFSDLQTAMQCPGVSEIRVAEGTYYPTSGTDRIISFELRNNLKILGGYPSGGGSRNLSVHQTTLSGDIGVLNDTSDNSYYVLFTNVVDTSAVLDGFIIQSGNSKDVGGGMFNISGSPQILNCVFKDNFAKVNGGAMYNVNSSSPILTNCLIAENAAIQNGGGMFNVNNSHPELINCTITKNSAVNGGGMFNANASNPIISNSILWDNGTEIIGGNPVITYSLIEGNGNSGSNIDVDPLFINPAMGDFHLGPCSPAKDVANGAIAPDTDLDGEMRPIGSGYDMGYDEEGTTAPAGLRTWTGDIDAIWSKACNWSPTYIPTHEDDVVIPATVNTPEIMDGSIIIVKSLTIDNTATLKIKSGASLSVISEEE